MHHSREESDFHRRLRDEFGLGPTGDFPQGKLNPTDEGGLKIATAIENGKVVLAFGKPVAWIGFDANQAIELARSLEQRAKQLRREGGG